MLRVIAIISTEMCQYCRCDRHLLTVTCTGHNIILRTINAPHWVQTLYFHHMSLRHLPHFAFNDNIRILRINFCGLTHIHPLSLTSLPNLQSLHLADNLIVDLPSECFFELTKLRIVNLARNLIHNINFIGEIFPKNHILEQFSLDGNPIESCSVGIQLPLVRQLYLSSTNMQSINDSAIIFLPSSRCIASETLCRTLQISSQHWSILRTLDLSSHKELTIQPSFLGVITNVTTLNLDESKLPASFPDWLQFSSRARHLSLSSSTVVDTNHTWKWCGEYLEWLDISYTDLRVLIIPSYCQLRYLKANGNHLREASIDTTSLVTLFLEQNELTSWIIPPPGNTFSQLLTLSLASNKIRYLPENALTYYPQLQHFDISHNILTNLSHHSFPTIGMQVRFINMSHNKLSRFVHPVLPSLLLLDLSSNTLQGLDTALLAGLPLLQHFYLGSNVNLFAECDQHRECWVLSLNQLGNLIDLDLSDCNLEWQPDLSKLQALRKLDLSRNRLPLLNGALLPRSLYHLDVRQNLIHYFLNESYMKSSELREIKVSQNPLICDCKLLEMNRWIPNDTYSASTNDLFYCFSEGWQYPLRSYLDTVKACLPAESLWPPTSITVVIGFLLCITLISISFIFVTNWRVSRYSRFLSFTYKPLRTHDISSTAIGM
ncbi:unnamed protein product [Thelazia callipaeda]|uniref:LRRCT domain-containing protein n=1 Tax=Thelazia callipaeda TaxID=103827 RepID=A0A0N5CK29_THECL|nr:unnamed protein product [Thelazia callipaeda]